MALADLLDVLEREAWGDGGTPGTPEPRAGFQRKPAPMLARTPGTSGTPKNVDTQHSGAVPDSGPGWTDADIARFIARRDRLLRRGWPESVAEVMAERLARRDREGDPRVSCTECLRYGRGRCGNHRAAGLHSAEVGRDLAAMLQHCPGFNGAPHG